MTSANRWTGSAWPRRFDGARGIVFGGASGIGLATVRRLTDEGARVVVADRTVPSDFANSEGVEAIQCDISSPAAVDNAFEAAVGAFGGIDFVVNTVGIVFEGSVQRTSRTDWDRIVNVNLTGAFTVTQTALRVLGNSPHSSITHVASDAGLVGWPDQAAYCAAKAGLVHFVRAAALDAAPQGVRVNCVCPSFTETPLVEAWIADTEDPDKTRGEIEAIQPLGRMAQPQEIAAAIAFLSSHEAGYVTGISLPVDGGVVAQ